MRAEALPLDPFQFRADFPILATTTGNDHPLVYLDNAATTQRPRQVIRKLVEVYEHDYANVHRGIHWLSERSTDLFEGARRTVQAFVGARHEREIVFTSGTTMAINLVARSWGDARLRAGDEILLTLLEHHSNIVPWQQLAQRVGATIRWIPINDQGQLQLDALDTVLNERTRLVALTAVSNVLGTVNPVAAIIARAHALNAVVLVDAAQSVPHRVTSVQELDADFLVFSGHKLLAPSGIGVLYAKEHLLESMPPFLGGGSMIQRVTLEGFEPAALPAKFEAGTPAIAPAIGLAEAIRYVETVGLERIAQHEHRLVARAHELLGDLKGIRLLGPPPAEKAGIVSFVIDGIHPHDVAQILDNRHGIAVRAGHHCAMPLHKRLGVSATTRASFYLYNTLEEVERLAHGVSDTQRVFRRR